MHQIVSDWRQAGLNEAIRRLTEFAEKVTRSPATCAESDIVDLRAVGWRDASIHDAVQVIAYYNYMNRIAEALGVELERGLPHWGAVQTSADSGHA